jgi:hypothetical protein
MTAGHADLNFGDRLLLNRRQKLLRPLRRRRDLCFGHLFLDQITIL